MTHRTPAQIQRWLEENLHRMDLPSQFLGSEPNAVRKPWDTASVRWCLVAAWPYEAAAGNQSIPAVYKAINIGRVDFLADRFYLPATPRDLRLLEKAGIPIFGIETKRQLADFDVIGSSIAYPVLSMSYVKMLRMSGIPLRWRDRQATGPGNYPMVIVGGQCYGAPEVLSPVVDCWWLGEVEDEPGNPGIAAVTARIADFKASGQWTVDRLACYQDLAREFNFLYFPRFVDVHYHYENRTRVGVGSHPSKQVAAYTANLTGMRMPFTKRHVKDLDRIQVLDDPPLLFSDPAMGSGDIEVGRGCPAWCSFCALCLTGDSEMITSEGVRRLDSMVGETVEVWTSTGWNKAEINQYGISTVNRIQFVPAVLGGYGGADTCRYGHSRDGEIETGSHQAGRNAKLSMEIAGQIREKHAAGVTQATLALEFGVSKPRISEIVRGLAWMPNKRQPALSGHACRVCQRIRAKNRYYIRTGRPELVQARTEVPNWKRQRGWRQLGRPTVTHTVYATPTHRWPLVDGGETQQLKVGDFVRAECVREVEDSQELERGFIHGIIFGDGSEERTTLQGRIFKIGLFGAKDLAHVHRFKKHFRPELRYSREPIQGLAVLRVGEPRPHGPNRVPMSMVRLVTDIAMKDFPEPSASPDYVRGFLEGWLAADGTASDGAMSVELCSQHPRARVWLERYASLAGWVLIGDCVSAVMDTNLMRRKAPLHGYTLTRGVSAWKVVNIDENVDTQPVYCATVPGVGYFTLANGIYTGNSWRTKPYRQMSVGHTVAYAKAMQANMGSVRMAPFSPDFPMHTQRKRLIAELLENVSDEVDAPTMRVDDFIADNQFMLLQVHGGMDAVTLGVEGNSQRMRDLVGKGTADADIKEAVARGIRAGIRKFKLYMISNLPGEDEGDVFRILKLAKELADIRESMNQPNVRIQFSWTPLMVEANTPMQWFAPPPANRILGDVWEEFRDLNISFKLGAKAEPNKSAFFQLCQRASRDVGEALVDAMEAIDQACWGGVPRTFKDLIEDRLHAWGFHNGYGDCFDERFKADMFGWEFIDQGVSGELLWATYLQMREFLEQTDSHTYDANYDSSYHGNEWIARCDERCQGKRCGACDHDDLKIRVGYLRASLDERDIDLSAVTPVDQRSQAMRIRVRIHKDPSFRYVMNDHWRFAVRRAAFRAQDRLGLRHGIAKRSIRFASDDIKYKDWTCGVDYLEFALTRPYTPDAIGQLLTAMNQELDGRIVLGEWVERHASSTTLRADVATSLFELEVDDDLTTVASRLQRWNAEAHIPMQLRIEGGYFAPVSESVNAKDYVDDLWLVKDGYRLKLRMLVRGRPSPYNIYAALMGRSSWLDAAKIPAVRLEAFVQADRSQQDFLRPNCVGCGLQIPTNILDHPDDPTHCPRCKDEHDGVAVHLPYHRA